MTNRRLECENMASSTKPEVAYITSQRRQSLQATVTGDRHK